MPVWSVSLLAFAPFLRLALARRRARDWWVFAAYLAATAAVIVLMSVVGDSDPGSSAVGGAIIVLMGFASVHTFIAFRPGAGPVSEADARQASSANEVAVTAAEARVRRREDARKLARNNPVLARDLRIGRPDLPRQYDDGGLVDVNHVPTEVLASHLDLSPQEAATVVAARAKLGRFSSPEELSVYSELQPDRVDELRDLMFFG